MNTTPLRYPGGKSVMTSFFEELIKVNSMKDIVYAEPYAGGAGSAINLILNEKVEAIKINDVSIGIYSFWHFLLNESDSFLKYFETAPVNLEEWFKQRTIFRTAIKPSLELGFATFFLSRTNRSGILNAGVIGGQEPIKQSKAKYKIDCRYNKDTLYNKLLKIIEKRDRIHVYNDDALTFLNKIKNNNALVYLDPPYYKQGKALYLNYYKHKDHVNLSVFIKNTNNFRWILSYDNVKEIQDLYLGFNLYEFNLTYTANRVKQGSELLTHSKNLILPGSLEIKRKSSNIQLSKILN